MISNCAFCHRPALYLTRFDTRRTVVLEPVPDDRGRTWVAGSLARVLEPEEAEIERGNGRELYLSHFAVCPARRRRFRQQRAARRAHGTG